MQQSHPQPSPPNPPQQTLQSISRQQLIDLFKQKAKQSKGYALKNSRLQTKYLTLFKQTKLIKKDHATFLQLIKLMFNLNQQEKQIGSWQLSELKQKWDGILQSNDKRLEEMESRHKQEILELQQKLKKQYLQLCAIKQKQIQKQKQKQSKQTQFNNKIVNYQNQINKLNNDKQKLSEEISRVDYLLVNSDAELNRLAEENRRYLEEIQKMKESEGQFRLGMKEKNKKLELMEEGAGNAEELERIRQDLRGEIVKNQELNQAISKLEEKLRERSKEIEILKQRVLENERKGEQSKKPKILTTISAIEIEMPIHSHSNNQKIISRNKDKDKQKQKQMQIQPLQKVYIKNTFVRFMRSINENNHLQAETLFNVLMTLLECNSTEREMATVKQKTWWGIWK